MRLLTLPTRLLVSMTALLCLCAFVAQGCSKPTLCQEGSDAEFVKEAPIAAEFKAYLPQGAVACGLQKPRPRWKKSQIFSFEMTEVELKVKFRDKNASLQAVECEAIEDGVCFVDGLKWISAHIEGGNGSVLYMNFIEETPESLGAQCTDAQKVMKAAGGASDGGLVTFIERCGQACDAKHIASCGHLAKDLEAVCGANKFICKELCGHLKAKSANKLTCELVK